MLACSPIESGGEDKSATSAISAIIDRQFLEANKIKSVDHRKLLANEKFEKIGHLPLSNMVGQMKPLQSAEQSEEKLPVLEMMPGGGFDSDMSYGGSVGGGTGSGEYQRPCNCTKSYCLKLYCECFARDKLCVNCNCSNCMNNVGHEKSRSTALLRILDKNPLAFLPKIGATSVGAGGLRHKLHRKGCNCKRSECLKNYCECRE